MVTQTTTRTRRTNGSKSNIEHSAPYLVIDQFIYLILGIMEVLLAFRFVFRLAGANPGVPFVSFIYNVTNVLMAPFNYIFPTLAAEGAVFEWSILVAMFVYALFAWVLTQLVHIFYTASFAE